MAHAPPKRRNQHSHTHHTRDDEELEEEEYLVPPDGGWGWVVVLASFAIHIVTDGITYSFGLFFIELSNYFNASKATTATISSVLVGVTLCSGPISSSFVNRYGCRTVTIVGSILASACFAISVFVKNIFVLILTVGLGVGFGFGLIYLPSIVSVTMYFEKRRSLATGIAVCGSGFGTVIFSPLIEKLIGLYGWQGAMLILSGIVLHCVIYGAMFRPIKPTKRTRNIEMATKDTKSNLLELPNGSANNNNSEKELLRSQSINEDIRKQNTSGETRKDNNGGIKTILKQASSQPLLAHNTTLGTDFQSIKESGRSESGTMYRADILYQGSLTNIPQYRSHSELSQSSRYGSLRRTSSHEIEGTNDTKKVCGCCPCSRETRDIFTEMLNFSLFKDPIFIIFTLSNFLTSIGFNIPYLYLVAQGMTLGLTEKDGSYLISVIGFANTISRIMLGYVSDKPYINRLYLYIAMLCICGTSTLFSVLCLDFTSLAVYSSVFGVTAGAYVGLTSVILVDLLGLEKLTNAFGLLLLFQGVASLIGPVIGGLLYDSTKSYHPAFYLAGGNIAMSGLLLFAILPIRRHLARKQQAEEAAAAIDQL